MDYTFKEKRLAWNSKKNEWLKLHRRVSFEDVVLRIEEGGLLSVVEHWNSARYPGQWLLMVESRGYAYLVPFVETENEVFLKTIFPSRKATRDYLGGLHGEA